MPTHAELSAKLTYYQDRVTEIETQIELLKELPSEPEGEVCCVWYRKMAGRNSYWTYCAVRAPNDLWYTTRQGNRFPAGGMSWEQLLSYIGQGEPTPPEIWQFTEMEQISG